MGCAEDRVRKHPGAGSDRHTFEILGRIEKGVRSPARVAEKEAVMQYTISTHNGSAVSRQHNLRNPKVVNKQDHIVKDGKHETWIDKPHRQAYQELFGEAQEAYNRRQIAAGRPGRCIRSYYDQIVKDSQKHAVYEMIISIGSRYNRPPKELAKAIFREFVENWPKRNITLKLVGAYYHEDEEGVPHVHIDYVPVATGYKNGMAVQNGLVRALEAIEPGKDQRFEFKSARDTAQIQWERRENAYLEELCRERGLEIEHPLEEGRKHLHTEAYKAKQDLETMINRYINLKIAYNEVCDKHNKLAANYEKMLQDGRKKYAEFKDTLVQQKAQIDANKEQMEASAAELQALEQAIDYKREVYRVFGGDPKDLSMFMPDPGAGERDEELIDFDELLRS